MYFRNYGLQKTLLHKYLESPLAEDPLTSNTVNGPKDSSNLHDTTFTIFIDQREGNWIGKSLSQWYVKSYGIFLTQWVPMGSIFFLHRDKLRQPIWMYLSKKQKTCLIFATFFKFTSNFKHFEGKDDPDILCISRITDCKKCYINVLKVTLQNTFRQATW